MQQYQYKEYTVTVVEEASLLEPARREWCCVVDRGGAVFYNGPDRRSQDEARTDAESWIESQH